MKLMHGGNLRKAQELYGLNSYLDLSANINPFGPPLGVWASIQQRMGEIVNYPDPENKGLRETLAHKTELPLEMIMVGNGAGELIFTIINALKPKKVLIPIPTFSEYERAARSVEANVSYITLGSDGWNKFNKRDDKILKFGEQDELDKFWRKSLEGCDLLFLCSPHNPTGSLLEISLLERILKISKEQGCFVLFDESFLDFLPDNVRHSARSFLADYEHLIVLYSLTKFYSLPGLRLGAAFAHPQLINRFEKHRDPWSVNVIAQYAGITALTDVNYSKTVREKLNDSKNFFYQEFEKGQFTELRLWPSSVNFALIQVLNDSVKELIHYLGLRGILVRDCSSFEGLEGNYIRVAMKDVKAMKQLIKGLKDFYFPS